MEYVERINYPSSAHDVADDQIVSFVQGEFLPPNLQAVRLEWRGELSGPLDVTLQLQKLGSTGDRWEGMSRVEGRWEGGEGELVREIELPSWMGAADVETLGLWALFWRSASGDVVRATTRSIDFKMRCPDPKQPPKRSVHPRQRHA